MSTKMISNIHMIGDSWFGENYPFNCAARYAMGCLGEMTLADYSLIAGITGDTFLQFYPHGGDSASDIYLGLCKLPTVFEKLGYEAESFSERDLQSDRERYLKRITGSIDRGIPAIWHRAGPTGVIVGYESDGNTLLYLSGSKAEPEPG